MVGSGNTTTPSRHAVAKAYKSATPALNAKLQRYKEDPEALEELKNRIRQHRTTSRPVTPESPRPASASAAGPLGSNLPASSTAAVGTFRQHTPRNFVAENAGVVTPWPCTGALSSTALAAATSPRTGACTGLQDTEACGSTATSSNSSLAVTPRHKPATEPQLQAPCQVVNPFAHPHQQDGPWSPLGSPRPTPAPSNSIMATASNSSSCSMDRVQSNSRKSLSNSSDIMSRISTSPMSMFRSYSQKPHADNQRQNLCLKQLGMHIAAKRETSAARAASAAERRTALAEAQQQRRVQISGRSERLQAERLAAEQAEAAAQARQEAQAAWSGVILSTAVAADLAAMLAKRRRQGAAAVIIAEAYKRCLLRRRHQEFVQLIIKLRRAIKPKLPQLLQAAHQRCAERVLLYLQRNTENNMLLRATQKFRHSISVIQQYWRQVQSVRSCQEELLYTAIKQLEQQIVSRNCSAAAQAALASELEANVQGRQRAGRTPRGGSGSGSRAVSGNGASNNSGRQRSSNLLPLADVDVVAETNNSLDRRSNDGDQQHQGAAHITVPYVRGGATLFTPQEFFADADEPWERGDAGSISRLVDPEPTAAATPRGPITPRGGYMTGQLKPQVLANISSWKLGTFNHLSETAGSSSCSTPRQHDEGPGCSMSSICSMTSSAVSGRPRTAGALSNRSVSSAAAAAAAPHRPTSAATASSVSAGAGCVITGGTVGWYADVVDLEVEAKLKDLFAVLPHGVRRQIVCSHLAAARRQLVKEREAHAAAMQHYSNRLELEKLKQKLLKEAGLDAQISLQPPQRPRMKVLVSKEKLKLLVIQGMELLQYQSVAARVAADDAAGTACYTARTYPHPVNARHNA